MLALRALSRQASARLVFVSAPPRVAGSGVGLSAGSSAPSSTAPAAAAQLRGAQSKRVVALFRKMCRAVPAVRTMYIIDESPAEIRGMLLLQFRRSGGAGGAGGGVGGGDPRLLDMLLAKGEMELQEAMNQWKQRGHLMQLIKPELDAADPLLDIGEHMARFADGSLDFRDFTKGYRPSELAAAARQLEAAIAAGTYKSPARLPGASTGGRALPWAEDDASLIDDGASTRATTA